MPLAHAIISGLLLGGLMFLPAATFAFSLPAAWDGPLCSSTGLCAISSNTGFLDLSNFINDRAIPIFLTGFTGVVIAYFTVSGFMLMVKSHDESTITEQKRLFGQGAIGLAVVCTARLIHAVTAPAVVGAALVDVTPFQTGVTHAIHYIFLIMGAVLVLLLTIAGIRLILSQGNDSEVEKQKKYFLHALLGVIAILIAGPIVMSIVPGGTGVTGVITQAGGIARFVLEIFGAFAVISMVASGVFYLTSIHNEERKERAKRLFVATIIAILLVLASYALIFVFS